MLSLGSGLRGREQAEYCGRHDSGPCDGRSVGGQKGWRPAVRMAPPLGSGLAAWQWQRSGSVKLGRGAHSRRIASCLGWEHQIKARGVGTAGAIGSSGMALYTGSGARLQVFCYRLTGVLVARALEVPAQGCPSWSRTSQSINNPPLGPLQGHMALAMSLHSPALLPCPSHEAFGSRGVMCWPCAPQVRGPSSYPNMGCGVSCLQEGQCVGLV